MFTLSNQELSIRVSHAGAELQSLRDLRNDRECLWQGDARWWPRRAAAPKAGARTI